MGFLDVDYDEQEDPKVTLARHRRNRHLFVYGSIVFAGFLPVLVILMIRWFSVGHNAVLEWLGR
jgi:hypothetical protein